MKFGSEFNDRSISKWKNYNIDYNDLKQIIKLATSPIDLPHRATSSSSSSAPESSDHHHSTSSAVLSSDQTTASIDRKQKRLLKGLYKSFKEQIEFVSLFVNSKYGEISRRILTIKNSLNDMINDSQREQSQTYRRLKKRKLFFINKELNNISTDLQELSRFILLQKIAIKKLLKKFLKYSDYQYKQELVNKINEQLINNDVNSFANLSLNDAALELTLMFDVLNNYYNDGTLTIVSPNSGPKYHDKVRQNSVVTLDSLHLPTTISDSIKSLYSKATTFDLVSRKKAPVSQCFWVHNDNLDELRFLLLQEFKLISDDTGLDEQEVQRPGLPKRVSTIQLKKTRSSLDLTSTTTEPHDTFHEPAQHLSHNDDYNGSMFHPQTGVVSTWLNNIDNPMMTQSNTRDSSGSSTNDTTIGEIRISNEADKYSKPLLIAPIGGLRQFSVTSIPTLLIDDLFYSPTSSNLDNDALTSLDNLTQKKAKVVDKWKSSGMIGNPKMAQLSLDWCLDKKMKPLAKIHYDRLRFIDLNNQDSKIDCYITLDSEVSTTKIINPQEQLKTGEFNWTQFDDSHQDFFKHSVLEIRYDSPNRKLSDKVNQLIDSHLVYKVDNLNFSMSNYLFAKYYPEHLNDSILAECIMPWFEELENKDIRKLPELNRPESPAPSSSLPQKQQTAPLKGILLNKNEVPPLNPHEQQSKGYWNEFDNGSDYGDDGGFYVDTDESDEGGILGYVFGGMLTNERIDSILSLSNKISDRFSHLFPFLSNSPTDPRIDDLERQSLITNYKDPFYHSLSNESNGDSNGGYRFHGTHNRSNGTISDSDTSFSDFAQVNDNRRRSIIQPSDPIYNSHRNSVIGPDSRSNEMLKQINHDKILTFVYMTFILLCFLISGIGMGVIISVSDSPVSTDPDFESQKSYFMILIFGAICLCMSFILSVASTSVLICRYSSPPLWHNLVVWSGVFVSTVLFVVSICVIF